MVHNLGGHWNPGKGPYPMYIHVHVLYSQKAYGNHNSSQPQSWGIRNGLVGWIVEAPESVKIRKTGSRRTLGQTGQKAMLVPVTLDKPKMGESWVPCGSLWREEIQDEGSVGISWVIMRPPRLSTERVKVVAWKYTHSIHVWYICLHLP